MSSEKEKFEVLLIYMIFVTSPSTWKRGGIAVSEMDLCNPKNGLGDSSSEEGRRG